MRIAIDDFRTGYASLRYLTPLLLVQGGRDRLAPPGDTDRLLTLLPDARAVIVPRPGHLALLRVPTVRGAVPALLAGVGTSPA